VGNNIYDNYYKKNLSFYNNMKFSVEIILIIIIGIIILFNMCSETEHFYNVAGTTIAGADIDAIRNLNSYAKTLMQPNGTLTNPGNLTVSDKLDVLGGSKLVVQNDKDGGSSNGIYMWNKNDTNWGIYMSTPGAGKSLANGIASSNNNITGHAVRFRAYNGPHNGFIFENHSEQPVMSINSGTGNVSIQGLTNIHAGNPTTPISSVMDKGSLTIGDTAKDYGNGAGWNPNTAGLLMECKDNTEIAVHDAGSRVASLISYQGGANKITIGRDMGSGWGGQKVNINGSNFRVDDEGNLYIKGKIIFDGPRVSKDNIIFENGSHIGGDWNSGVNATLQYWQHPNEGANHRMFAFNPAKAFVT
jgi:hypothetical protein